MPIEKGDLDRLEDNLRSELEWLRGKIDGIADTVQTSNGDVKLLESSVDSIKKDVNTHSTKIDRLIYAFLGLLIVIIGVLIEKLFK